MYITLLDLLGSGGVSNLRGTMEHNAIVTR
jgi:hypothetical protein